MDFDFEGEALAASRVLDKVRILEYLRRLDDLLSLFERQVRPGRDPLRKARELFAWLWRKKPERYKAGAAFRLHEVIDAQLREGGGPVGNCLGLTLFYNSLLRRKGFACGATYLENAFGIAPHVLTELETRTGPIDVENILPHGFDYKGHHKEPNRKRLGDRELVAEIYKSAGNTFFSDEEFGEALRNYEQATRMDPGHESAALNRLVVADRIAMERGTGNR